MKNRINILMIYWKLYKDYAHLHLDWSL